MAYRWVYICLKNQCISMPVGVFDSLRLRAGLIHPTRSHDSSSTQYAESASHEVRTYGPPEGSETDHKYEALGTKEQGHFISVPSVEAELPVIAIR